MRRALWIAGAVALLVAGTLPVAAQNNLTYYGGPVVGNAQIVAVSWGPADSTMTSVLPNFFNTIRASPYWNVLSEYSTTGINGSDGQPGSNQNIYPGTFGQLYQITPSIGGTTVTDAQIAQEMSSQITAGNLPAPSLDSSGNVNTVYMVYFPTGVSITIQGYINCEFNSDFSTNGTNVPYGAIAYQGSAPCTGQVKGITAYSDQLTAVSSAILANIVTDPLIGLTGNQIARPAAWFSGTKGQLGFICQTTVGGVTYFFTPGTILNVTVAQLWSNLQNKCTVSSGFGSGLNSVTTTITPSAAVVEGGSSVSLSVSAVNNNGFQLPIQYSASGLPSGITATVNPNPLNSGQPGTLTFTADTTVQFNPSVSVSLTGTYSQCSGCPNAKTVATVTLEVIASSGGTVGPQGPAGPAGPAGPQGPQGDPGPAGATGPAGSPGPQGASGPIGATGPAGPVGPAGPQGQSGAIGAQGATGPAGPQGSQGPSGLSGAVGPIGPIGPMGAAGLQGPQGVPGLQGPPGTPGPTGTQLWTSYVPLFLQPYTVAALTPDNAIQLTRIQAQVGIPPSKCSTNAALIVSDGTTTQNLPITAAANDSGPITVNFAAGAHITMSLGAPARCSIWPASASVAVQYKVR